MLNGSLRGGFSSTARGHSRREACPSWSVALNPLIARALHLREPSAPRAPYDVPVQEQSRHELFETVERWRKVYRPLSPKIRWNSW
jgi:hypothetical protein